MIPGKNASNSYLFTQTDIAMMSFLFSVFAQSAVHFTLDLRKQQSKTSTCYMQTVTFTGTVFYFNLADAV